MPKRTFDSLLKSYSPTIQDLARATRGFVTGLIGDADEAVDTSGPYVFYSIGAGYSGLVCTLILSKANVKIGLPNSSNLYDPDGYLEGRGKVHRHVKIEKATDLKRPGLRRLIKAHLKAWHNKHDED
jgi:hypothetical protein